MRRIVLQVSDQRPVERLLLADLDHGAPDPVDVVGRGGVLVAPHPRQQVVLGREAAAEREDPAQAGAGAGDEVGEDVLGRAVAVAEEHERRRPGRRDHAVDRDVASGRRIEHDEAREVQALERAERHQRVVRVDHARPEVHRGEERAQVLRGAVHQRCQHREARLRRHAQRSRRRGS